MKHTVKSWIGAILLSLAAIFGLGYAEPARAFTLVELLVIPSEFLVANQLATVAVSNTTAGPNAHDIHLVAAAVNDRGTVFKTEGNKANPITISPNQTFHFGIRAPSTGNLSFHTMIELDTANAAVGDVMGWDVNTGQLISIMQGQVTLPAVQDIPAVGLAAGQSALVKVTNVSANNLMPTISLFMENGKLIKTMTPTVAPNQTFTHRVTATNGNLALFATVNWGDGSVGLSDVMTLDQTTGQVIAILPYVLNGN
ncbi:MAG TPA: hypothetical protein VM755_03610 [Stellaceae bacterium]|nr:hypothetical protein [Stellaceae bacterium]